MHAGHASWGSKHRLHVCNSKSNTIFGWGIAMLHQACPQHKDLMQQQQITLCWIQGASTACKAYANCGTTRVGGFPGTASSCPQRHVGDDPCFCESSSTCLACCRHAQSRPAQAAHVSQVRLLYKFSPKTSVTPFMGTQHTAV